jgi:hypothetical protein
LSLDLDETDVSPGNIPVNIGLKVEIGDKAPLTWGGVVKNCAEENGGDLSKCGDANEAIKTKVFDFQTQCARPTQKHYFVYSCINN